MEERTLCGMHTEEKELGGFAYAAIIRITNDKFWRFQPPTPFDEAFNDVRITGGGISWSEQLLQSSSKGDWASGLWEDMGGEVPEFWLVRRRVTHLDDTTRAVIDYREPWPEAIRSILGGTLIVTDEGDKALQEFLARADAAFLVEKKTGEFTADAPKTEVKKPRIPLKSASLVGNVIQVHNN